jgi:hypothetical protein
MSSYRHNWRADFRSRFLATKLCEEWDEEYWQLFDLAYGVWEHS